ncbi:winged helix-turn-helix domain-containing protein, partial [Xanthomonas citri pv. citri]
MFSLKLLGGAIIEGPQGLLAGRASQRRRLALLCVLARVRERPISRDKLLALFWPESDSERARHSLADSLYQLRKELGDNAILSTGDDLRPNSDLVTSD